MNNIVLSQQIDCGYLYEVSRKISLSDGVSIARYLGNFLVNNHSLTFYRTLI